jgi:hypothetical protein
MSMPPQGTFLPGNIEPVGEVVVWKDGVLGYHRHTISPAVEPLLHSMPTRRKGPNDGFSEIPKKKRNSVCLIINN